MNHFPTVHSLNDLRALIKEFPTADETAAETAREREPQLTKPAGSLGRLEHLSVWLAAWQGRHPPTVDNPTAHVFAGNHGVTRRGVSAFPPDVTVQMVANFTGGGAAINQLCRTFGVGLEVQAMSLDLPTGDICEEAAMSEDETLEAILTGMEAVKSDTDICCLGEMGIGNTTSAAAICHALYGGKAEDWTGPGTGVEGKAMKIKTAAVADAVSLHLPNITDSIDVIRLLGGRELAAIVGAVIAARIRRIPIILDGYVCTSAAAILNEFQDRALDHCQIGHISKEPGHRRLLEKLNKKPLLDLDMRLGEASGAVLAVGLLKAAVACHNGMATFADAGVSDKS